MSNTTSASIKTGCTLSDSKPNAGTRPSTTSDSPENDVTWTNGGANTVALGADTVYGPVVLNLAASATTTLNVQNGSLTTLLGASIAAARIKGIYAWNVAAGQKTEDGTSGAGVASTTLTLGGDCLCGTARPMKQGTYAAADGIQINNGCSVGFSFDNAGTGYTVTASSTDQIKVINQDGTNAAVCELMIVLGST